MLNNLSLFFSNDLIHFTLYSVFVYYVWQKFVVTLTLTDWLIEIISRVRLWQWRESVSELKHSLSKSEMFDWRRKQELSRLFKEWCKSRKNAEQKRFIISILTLIQKELKNFSIYWDQWLIWNIFLWELKVHFLLNDSAEFNCSKNKFSALTLSKFTVRCIRIVVVYCDLKLWLNDAYMRLKFCLKRDFYASFKRNCRHLQHSFLTTIYRNDNVFIFSVAFCSIITLIIILRKVWWKWTVIAIAVLCLWQRFFVST